MGFQIRPWSAGARSVPWPDLVRPSTTSGADSGNGVDGRHKAGHDTSDSGRTGRHLLALAAALLFGHLLLANSARADSRLDLAALQPLSPLTDLVVAGENQDLVPRAVTIRIDDRPGADYSDRVNEERIMPPGPFTVRLRLALLRTPRHRALHLAAVFRVIVFAPEGGHVAFERPRLDVPPGLPTGVKGWFFGPAAAVPLSGFELVVPGDPRVSGPHVEQIERPGSDPVLAHGVRLTLFKTTLHPGLWRLTFWTEDPGAWETLPVMLDRRIRVNGSDLSVVKRDYAGWVAQRYLAGRTREADPSQPPFASVGALRGDRVSGIANVAADGVLAIELAGFPQTATHLAALTAEPADIPEAGESAVEAVRAARFAENWPVLAGPPPAPHAARVAVSASGPAVTAPGGVAIVRFEAVSPGALMADATVVWDNAPLPVRLLWGQWQWRRPGAGTAGLAFSAGHLRGDADHIPLRGDLPRPIVLIADGGAPGIHRGRLRLHTGLSDIEAPFTVEVLPVTRPAPSARVGAFLGFAPHLLGTPDWSKDQARRDARAQAACDLDTLSRLGLTAVTAPLTASDVSIDDLVADIRTTLARFPAPIIGYETLRGFAFSHQAAEAAAMVARVDSAIRQAGLPPAIWSIADEPGYAGTVPQVHALAEAIHAVDPDALLAGHLNDPRDTPLLPDLALVTTNPGFGADAADIDRLRARGIRPWLYNMPQPRLAAGAYLWRSGADGLLQWHARMPTADAFDPTDGREGDVQFLWPTPGICAPADLDEDLLSLVEAEEDLRWLAWLDAAAATDPEAARLRRKVWLAVPDAWAAAAALPAEQPAAWRNTIMDLARKLKI